MEQVPLFELADAAQVSVYELPEGWYVRVALGDPRGGGRRSWKSDTYGPLSLLEALQVVDDSLRCGLGVVRAAEPPLPT